jgi:hypothetical protein
VNAVVRRNRRRMWDPAYERLSDVAARSAPLGQHRFTTDEAGTASLSSALRSTVGPAYLKLIFRRRAEPTERFTQWSRTFPPRVDRFVCCE